MEKKRIDVSLTLHPNESMFSSSTEVDVLVEERLSLSYFSKKEDTTQEVYFYKRLKSGILSIYTGLLDFIFFSILLPIYDVYLNGVHLQDGDNIYDRSIPEGIKEARICDVQKKFPTLRDYQMLTVEKCLEAMRGIISLPCGSGKTEIQMALASHFKEHGLSTLILVPDKALAVQTKERFRKIGITAYDLKGFPKHHKGLVVVTLPQSTLKFIRSKSNIFSQFDVLIVDETHHMPATTWQTISSLCDNAWFRFGFSATPLLGTKEEEYRVRDMQLVSQLGNMIVNIPAYELKEYLAIPKVKMIKASFDVSYRGKDFTVLHKILCGSSTRNQLICDIAKYAVEMGRKVLILVRPLFQGKKLLMLLHEMGITPIGFSCGSNRVIQIDQGSFQLTFGNASFNAKFEEMERGVGIGSQIYQEGQDMPSADFLINASGMKSPIKTIQSIGRLQRPKEGKDPILVDFYDSSNPILHYHSKRRVEEYGKNHYSVETEKSIEEILL